MSMSDSTAALAIIPPVFAMLVEALNPVNEAMIRTSAERALSRFETGADHKVLIDNATAFTAGAVEVSGLAPTLVAAVTSGFGVFHEWPDPRIIAAYILTLVALALFVLRYLAGQNFLQVQSASMPQNIFGYEIRRPWSGAKLVSRLIYFTNGLLVSLVLIVYFALEPPWHHFIDFARWLHVIQ